MSAWHARQSLGRAIYGSGLVARARRFCEGHAPLGERRCQGPDRISPHKCVSDRRSPRQHTPPAVDTRLLDRLGGGPTCYGPEPATGGLATIVVNNRMMHAPVWRSTRWTQALSGVPVLDYDFPQPPRRFDVRSTAWSLSASLGRLASLRGVVAFTVNRGHFRSHRAQIHRQLPAMVDRVMQDEVQVHHHG
jgi:hypothetical protein